MSDVTANACGHSQPVWSRCGIAAVVLLGFAVLTGCASGSGKTLPTVAQTTNPQNPAGQPAQADLPAQPPADGRCPPGPARFLTCANGVRLLTYEAAYDLAKFCEPVQNIETRLRRADAARTVQPLSGGERVMLVGDAGWLVLRPDSGLLDTPAAIARWWSNPLCSMPSALTR